MSVFLQVCVTVTLCLIESHGDSLAILWEERRKLIAGEDDRDRKPRPTLTDYAEQWLEDVADELEGKTLSRYRQDLETHVLPALGKRRLDEIDTPMVKAFLRKKRNETSERTGRPYAPDTLWLMRTALSSVLAEVVEDGLIQNEPLSVPRRSPEKGGNDIEIGAARHDPPDELRAA